MFDTPHRLPPVEPTGPLIDTPLGALELGICSLGRSFELVGQYGEGLPCLRRFRAESSYADLLLYPLDPSVGGGQRVDARIAAVWRIVAGADLHSLVLRAEWSPGASNGDGGYDTGEHLFALTWDAPGVRLSVGTSDEEKLAATAFLGELLPKRLEAVYNRLNPGGELPANLSQKEMGLFPRDLRGRDGLEVELPTLLANESVQVHFVVAWLEGKLDDQDASTWFAVDVDPREIARLAEQTLRASE